VTPPQGPRLDPGVGRRFTTGQAAKRPDAKAAAAMGRTWFRLPGSWPANNNVGRWAGDGIRVGAGEEAGAVG